MRIQPPAPGPLSVEEKPGQLGGGSVSGSHGRFLPDLDLQSGCPPSTCTCPVLSPLGSSQGLVPLRPHGGSWEGKTRPAQPLDRGFLAAQGLVPLTLGAGSPAHPLPAQAAPPTRPALSPLSECHFRDLQGAHGRRPCPVSSLRLPRQRCGLDVRPGRWGDTWALPLPCLASACVHPGPSRLPSPAVELSQGAGDMGEPWRGRGRGHSRSERRSWWSGQGGEMGSHGEGRGAGKGNGTGTVCPVCTEPLGWGTRSRPLGLHTCLTCRL